MTENYLFVYGSLRGASRHPMQRRLAARARHCGTARFRGVLYELDGYPGAVPCYQLQSWVQGDLYQLNCSELLHELDRYEGIGADYAEPYEYHRRQVAVELPSGAPLTAWIYLYNWTLAGRRQIADGDYLPMLGARSAPLLNTP